MGSNLGLSDTWNDFYRNFNDNKYCIIIFYYLKGDLDRLSPEFLIPTYRTRRSKA